VSEGFDWLQSTAAAQGPWITAVTVFLIVWFAIVAITGWLAARRNREGGLWAALALFIGPIALGLLLWLPRRAERPALSPLWEQLEAKESAATSDGRKAREGGPAT
jgi:hypothetical protein